MVTDHLLTGMILQVYYIIGFTLSDSNHMSTLAMTFLFRESFPASILALYFKWNPPSPMFRVQTSPVLWSSFKFHISPSTSENLMLFGTWRNHYIGDKLIPQLVWILIIGIYTPYYWVDDHLKESQDTFLLLWLLLWLWPLPRRWPAISFALAETLEGRQRALKWIDSLRRSSLKLWCLLGGQPNIEENTL